MKLSDLFMVVVFSAAVVSILYFVDEKHTIGIVVSSFLTITIALTKAFSLLKKKHIEKKDNQ